MRDGDGERSEATLGTASSDAPLDVVIGVGTVSERDRRDGDGDRRIVLREIACFNFCLSFVVIVINNTKVRTINCEISNTKIIIING